MNYRALQLTYLLLITALAGAHASEAPVARLSVYPPAVQLESKRAIRQLVVTGETAGLPRDLTSVADIKITDPAIARASGGRITALRDGKTTILVRAGGKSVQLPLVVKGCSKPDPVQFKFETLPLLTKQGCAGGSCHGSPHGKGGFSLSLFGYDPRVDKVSLTRDSFSRRINAMDPAESLMIKKPLLALPHVGGRRLKRTDTAYKALTTWIAEGASVDLPAVECEKIEVFPDTDQTLHFPYKQRQISVVSTFSDGTKRDVTAISTYETSHPSVTSVDMDGMVVGKSRGQSAVTVRYLDKLLAVNFTVVQEVPGFTWKQEPEANFVDRLVNLKLKQLKYLPSGLCNDNEFVRRVHLDLTGLLPTSEQTRAFLAQSSKDRRARLIDALLGSEQYARFQALKRSELMRVAPKRLTDGRAERFSNWIIDNVRSNRPYDQFAREILTSSGDTRSVAPANYFLAIPTVEERTEMTAQVFMGSRLECTKCHNHPFEAWTMKDYYSLAAVFARTRAANGTVQQVATGEARHPSTGDIMKPWGGAAGEAADRRTAFAEWLTRKGNPYFARVQVNRLWSDLMGRGIVEPVDDFRASNPASNGPLLDALAKEFERSGFDSKHILRLICNSRTYQRSTATNAFNKGEESLFSHAKIRRLTAEQIKDAIVLATRARIAPSEIDGHLAKLKQGEDRLVKELEPRYAGWLETTQKEVSGLFVRMEAWRSLGPFEPERGGNSTADSVLDGGTRHDDFVDGKPFKFDRESDAPVYLARRLIAREAGPVNFVIRTDTNPALWINGKSVKGIAQRGDVSRGEKRFTLDLKAGENRLLMRVLGGPPNAAVTFQLADKPSAPPPIVQEMIGDEGRRSSSEGQALLRRRFFDTEPRVRDIHAEQKRLEDRLDYATQRPVPELNQFSNAFGQPMRDTACTCERQNAPTLLQALELLNGDTAYKMAQSATKWLEKLDNAAVVEELYMGALSRKPTTKELEVAMGYLKRASDRKQALVDLTWTVVNMQEFLFQH